MKALLTKEDYEKILNDFKVKNYKVEEVIDRSNYVKITLLNFEGWQIFRKRKFKKAMEMIQHYKPAGIWVRFYLNQGINQKEYYG